jgi:hypothetical protein
MRRADTAVCAASKKGILSTTSGVHLAGGRLVRRRALEGSQASATRIGTPSALLSKLRKNERIRRLQRRSRWQTGRTMYSSRLLLRRPRYVARRVGCCAGHACSHHFPCASSTAITTLLYDAECQSDHSMMWVALQFQHQPSTHRADRCVNCCPVGHPRVTILSGVVREK